jgi:O-antigen/teichoic acid export membrane protein
MGFVPRCVLRVKGSRFAGNVTRLASANLLAQALLLVSAPLLTRMYTPADFGALGVFVAVTSIGLAFCTARFEWSIPNPRSAAQGAALLLLGVAVLALTSICIVAGLLAAAIGRVSSPWALGDGIWWLLPVAIAGGGFLQLLQSWHVRDGELRSMSRAALLQSCSHVLTVLGLGWALGPAGGVWGLLAGALVAAWTGAAALWFSAPGLALACKRLNRRRIVTAWRRYRGQAAWSTLAASLNALSLAVIPLMLARHYSVMEVGFYALTQRIAFAPIGLITGAVRQSFWAEAAQFRRSDAPALRTLYRNSTRRLAWFALLVACIAIAGPLYVGPIFGSQQWESAGWVLAASVPMLVGQVVVSPLSHLEVHGRQNWQAGWDLVRFVALLVTIEWVGSAALPLTEAVLVLSLVVGFMYAVLVQLNLRALALAECRTR